MDANQTNRIEQPVPAEQSHLSSDEQFRQAVNLARQGQWLPSRAVLQGMVERKEDDEQVWLWLAASYKSDQARLRILQYALDRHPGSALLEKALAAQQRIAAGPPASSPAGTDKSHAGVEPSGQAQGVQLEQPWPLPGQTGPSPVPEPPEVPQDLQHIQESVSTEPEPAEPVPAHPQALPAQDPVVQPPVSSLYEPEISRADPEAPLEDHSEQMPGPEVAQLPAQPTPADVLPEETRPATLDAAPHETSPVETDSPPPASRTETSMLLTAVAVIVLIILIAFLWAHFT